MPQIHTQGELAQAYLQTQHKLNLCVIENDRLKTCIEQFNQKDKP